MSLRPTGHVQDVSDNRLGAGTATDPWPECEDLNSRLTIRQVWFPLVLEWSLFSMVLHGYPVPDAWHCRLQAGEGSTLQLTTQRGFRQTVSTFAIRGYSRLSTSVLPDIFQAIHACVTPGTVV